MGTVPYSSNIKAWWEPCKHMGTTTESSVMSRRRALLTDRERELLAGENVTDESYRYQAASRIRNKIEDELTEDIELLEKHHPKLLAELREVVCEE